MTNSAADRRSPLGLFAGQPKPRLYDCVLEALRSRHYSRRTEEAYLHWMRRFLAFHNGTHPRELAERDLNRFLSDLATTTGIRRRHHLHESVIQKAVHQAAQRVGVTKRVTTHAFRHSFATHLLHDGYDIRTVQELLGHKDVRTTMVYTQVLNGGARAVHSPLDGLLTAVSSDGRGRIRPSGRSA